MIMLGPRHGKSELASCRFPAWFLGRNPDKRVIHSSYAATLSESFSAKVRRIVEGKKYANMFGITTDKSSRAKDHWDIAGHDGGMIAAGVGGAITGYGADLFIIDDPVKNKEEAESEVYREKCYEWYTSVARTRLQPGGAIILIMARWHRKDLAGRILENEKDWTVINFPAEIDGVITPIWPKQYDKLALELTKHDIGSRDWNALYNGNPLDPASQKFKRDWIRWYDGELPPKCELGGGIDTATSVKTTADNMAMVDVYQDEDGFLYAHHAFCDKLSVRAFAQVVCNYELDNSYSRIGIEENAAGEAVKQAIDEEGRVSKAYPPVKGFKTSTDKVVRASEFESLVENGTIKFNRQDAGIRALVEHLVLFDGKGSDIDDDVDALGFAIKAVKNSRNIIRYI